MQQETDRLIKRRLTKVFLLALAVLLGALWFVQTALIERKSAMLVEENRQLVRKVLQETNNSIMIEKARKAALMLPKDSGFARERLPKICREVGAAELDIIDTNGVIVLSTYPTFIGYVMNSHPQSKPFNCLLHGQREYVQDFMPTGSDSNLWRKFVGVALEHGGYLQLAFDEDCYLRAPDLSIGRTIPLIEIFLLAVVMYFAFLSAVKVFRNQFVAEAAHNIEKDLSSAKMIQTSILPNVFPPYPNLVDKIDLYATLRQAPAVSGDFYDFFFVRPGVLALVLADVDAQGIAVATFSAQVKFTLQALLRDGMTVAEAVAEACRRLHVGEEPDHDVSLWVGLVDLRTGRVEYVNRNQNDPIMLGAAENAKPVNWQSAGSLQLKPGEGLFLYTNGVVGAVNENHDKYGFRRLSTKVSGEYAKEIVCKVLDDIKAFAGVVEQGVDITMLAFKLNCYMEGEE